MGFFNKYPYTDFHELNLDWIISRMKQLEIEFDEFKVVNNITFSGQWDITKQYPAWTIVSDNNIGYVSIQPVPVGVVLTNSDYWVEVIDYTAQIAGLQQRVVNIENDISNNIKPDITTLQSDVVNLQSEIDRWNNFKHIFANKKVVILGDSISIPGTTWAAPFKTLVESIGGTVDNRAVGGYRADQCAAVAATLTEAYDIAIIWCGLNDVAHHAVPTDYTPLGNMGTSGTFNYYYNNMIGSLRALNNSMLIYNFSVSFAQAGAFYINSSLYYYSAAIKNVSLYRGTIFKNMDEISNNSVDNKAAMMPDAVHFTETFSKTYLLDAIVDKLSSPISERFSKHFDIYKDDITDGAKVTVGTVFGDHEIGASYDMTGLIIVNSTINANEEIFTSNFSYIPNQTWMFLSGANNKSGIGVNNGSKFIAYQPIDVGTYVFHVRFNPTYVNASRDQQYS